MANLKNDFEFEKLLKQSLSEIAEEQGKYYISELPNTIQPQYSNSFKKEINKLIKSSDKKKKKKHIFVAIFSFFFIFASMLFYDKYSDANKLFYITKLFHSSDDRTNISMKENQIEYPIIHLPDGWNHIYVPQYLPAGYSVDKIKADIGGIEITYKNSSERITFLQMNENNILFSSDNERSNIKHVLIGMSDGYIITDDTYKTLMWNNDSYSFTLISDIAEKELVKIAESITIYEK